MSVSTRQASVSFWRCSTQPLKARIACSRSRCRGHLYTTCPCFHRYNFRYDNVVTRHSAELIALLKRERHSGAPLPYLVNKYGLSKTTIWHHIKDVTLSNDSLEQLRARGGQVRGDKEWKRAQALATKLLIRVKADAVWVSVLAALYWSEGTKKSGFVFTNTDANMVRVFLKILRDRLNIPDSDFSVLVRTPPL